MRYLKDTMNKRLIYHGWRPTISHSFFHSLEDWSDADWIGDIDNCHFTLEYLFQLDSSYLFSCKNDKQPVLTLFSTEAKYIVAATATKKLKQMQILIQELGYFLNLPSIFYCDNQWCIALTRNPRFHYRSKHVDIHFHFFRKIVLA